MTREQFDALLVRREELESEHATACAILEEEGPDPNGVLYGRCRALYTELAHVQEEIDAELEAERAAESAAESDGG